MTARIGAMNRRRWLALAGVLVLAVVSWAIAATAPAFAQEEDCCRSTADCEFAWNHTCLLEGLGCGTGFDDYVCTNPINP